MKKIIFLFAIFCSCIFFGQETDSPLKDSLAREKTKTELRIAYEKEAAADSAKNAEMQKVLDAQLQAQNLALRGEKKSRIILLSIIGLFILLSIGGVIILIVKLTRRKKPNV